MTENESTTGQKKSGRGFTLIEVLIVLAVIGILAMIVNPSYMRFNPRAKQSEAKTNLGAIFTTMAAYMGEYGTYPGDADQMGDSFEQIGWGPEGDNRYSYYVGRDRIPCDKCSQPCPDPPPIYSTGSGFTAAAVGTIDRDATCDVWYINDAKRLWNMKMIEDGEIVEGSDLDDKSFRDRLDVLF